MKHQLYILSVTFPPPSKARCDHFIGTAVAKPWKSHDYMIHPHQQPQYADCRFLQVQNHRRWFIIDYTFPSLQLKTLTCNWNCKGHFNKLAWFNFLNSFWFILFTLCRTQNSTHWRCIKKPTFIVFYVHLHSGDIPMCDNMSDCATVLFPSVNTSPLKKTAIILSFATWSSIFQLQY